MRKHFLVALIVAAAGCGGTTETANVVGIYALSRVDGTALPASTYTSGTLSLIAIADTITLRDDGTGVEVRVQDQTYPQGTEIVTNRIRTSSALQYTVTGDRVEMVYVCPPNADCVPPPHLTGRVTTTGIVLTYALGARVPQEFAIVK